MTYPFDLSLAELIFISLLLFVSAAIQGILGFGFAVISSPILVQIEPLLVPQILSLLALPMAFRIYQREKKEVDWKPFKFLFLGRIIGGPLGLLLLINLNEKLLSISVGAIVLVAGIATLFNWTVNRNNNSSWIAGTLSGIFAMIAGVGGPPIAILYRGASGKEFRPSLNAVFTFGIMITLGLLLFSGEIYRDHIILFLYLAIPVAVGLKISSLLFSDVSDNAISKGVTYFSIISGLVVIFRNII
ncbi:sulfite exporter TauE/SafE family protein [Acidimicrobiaceae bacterium]|nr:sulfite exporter TauE/SafE family protein [Acidimicrobiaceae bacterium]